MKCCHVGDRPDARISYLCLEKSVDNGCQCCHLMFLIDVNDDNGYIIVHAITTGNRLVTAFERLVFRASYLTARGWYIKTGLLKRPRGRTIKY